MCVCDNFITGALDRMPDGVWMLWCITHVVNLIVRKAIEVHAVMNYYPDCLC
jgi:hypothetical protein